MLNAENPHVEEFLKFFNKSAVIPRAGEKVQFDLVENFKIHCMMKSNNTTAENYAAKITEFENELKNAEIIESLNDIDKSWDYQRYREVFLYYSWRLQRKGNKPQKIVKKFSVLNSFFVFLKDRDIVSMNPVPDFREANLSYYKITPEQRQAVSLEKLEEIISVGSVETKHWTTDEVCPLKTHLLRTCYLVLSKDLLRAQEFCDLNIGNFYLNEKFFMTGDFAKISGKRRPLDDQTIWHIKVYWWIREN